VREVLKCVEYQSQFLSAFLGTASFIDAKSGHWRLLASMGCDGGGGRSFQLHSRYVLAFNSVFKSPKNVYRKYWKFRSTARAEPTAASASSIKAHRRHLTPVSIRVSIKRDVQKCASKNWQWYLTENFSKSHVSLDF